MATNSLTFFFVFLSLLLSLFSPALSALCRPQDKQALLKIKNDINKNNPKNDAVPSWTPNTDCCDDWYGVRCDEKTHRVTDLYIDSETAAFQLPPAIGDLPYLTSLEFHKNPNLTGPIQPVIAKLTSLTFLRLDWNGLSGPIPDFLGKLKKLTYLNLSYNKFSGSIPASLGQLPLLGAIFAHGNQLTGSIPDSFGSFIPDFYLVLSHNELSGKLPATLGKVNFTKLDLSRNKLEGDASFLFGYNKMLQSLDLSRNLFEFNLSKVVLPKGLFVQLDLSHNKIYGGLTAQFTKLEFQSFNVSYNRLCGKIPVGGRLQTRFDEYSYFHNKCLCGAPLPPCK